MYEIISKLKFEKLLSKKLKAICQAGGKLNENLFLKIVNFAKKKIELNFIQCMVKQKRQLECRF